jgi:Hemerythrin HHE cation binding domain
MEDKSMNSLINKISPSATNMIRMDHTHVLSTFHQYEIDSSPGTKQALVNTICLALEIHAQLEEEIFYPAVRAVTSHNRVMDKSVPEHNEMRRLIGRLRSMAPTDAGYDDTVMDLMRDVIHHVADEETSLLPDAERMLGDRLGELGAQMTKRRLQLSAPHAGEIAMNTARGLPASTMVMAAGALLAGTYLMRRSSARRHTW